MLGDGTVQSDKSLHINKLNSYLFVGQGESQIVEKNS